MTTAKTQGVHHVGLTVADLEPAKRFFVEALGFTHVGGRPEYPSAFVSDGTVMLTLWQADEDATPADRRKRIGLHHLALKVADSAVLEDLHHALAKRDDVRIEFAPEPLGNTPIRHMMLYIPGNIRIELIALQAGAAS